MSGMGRYVHAKDVYAPSPEIEKEKAHTILHTVMFRPNKNRSYFNRFVCLDLDSKPTCNAAVGGGVE